MLATAARPGAGWWNEYRDQEVGVGSLWKLLNLDGEEPINLELGKGNEKSQRTRFGVLLGKQRDRQFDGFRIENAGTFRNAQRWRLTKVSV